MRRFLSALMILAVGAAAFLAAASIVPHAHEGRFDHAKNPDCPVHQAAGLSFDQAPDLLKSEVLLDRLAFIQVPESPDPSRVWKVHTALRGPPAVSL